MNAINIHSNLPRSSSNSFDKVLKRRLETRLGLLLLISRLIMPPHPITTLGPHLHGLKHERVRVAKIGFARLQL